MSISLLSDKEYAILDLLRSGQEKYGLEMVDESGGKLKRGTIYVTLQRMGPEGKGFVDSRKKNEPDRAGIARRLYRITGQGERALKMYEAAAAAARSIPTGGFRYGAI